jgi:putative PEP-CTERM system TPR-repeat lipoprotein
MTRASTLTAVSLTIASMVLPSCGDDSRDLLIKSAKSHLQQKDPRAAIIELKNALQKDGSSLEARLLLGRALLDAGDVNTAGVELRKAEKLGAAADLVAPSLARLMLTTNECPKVVGTYGNLTLQDPAAAADLLSTLAACFAQQGDIAKAREAGESALRLQPMYAPAVLFLARLRADDGDVPGAMAKIETLLAREPGNDLAHVALGDMMLRDPARPDAALQEYLTAVKVAPKSIRAYSNVVALLLRERRETEARQQLEQMQIVAPRHPETVLYMAQFAFLDGDYPKSRELADLVLIAAPQNLRALELAGAAEYRLGRYSQATSFLSQALKVAPGLTMSRRVLAQTYLRLGQPSKALDPLRPLVSAPEPDGEALAISGQAYLLLGDTKSADQAFKRAAQAAPGDPGVGRTIALSQLATGQIEGGIAALEQVASLDPGIRTDLALINARLNLNDFTGAIKAIGALREKAPKEPQADMLMGQVRLSQRDVDEARKSFEAALAVNPRYFQAVASLAAIDAAQGRPDQAKARLDALLKLEPTHADALLSRVEMAESLGQPLSKVLDLATEAVRLNPTDSKLRLALIGRQLAAGDGRAALSAAQSAAAALPDDADIAMALGRSQLAAGDGQQAVSTFKQVAARQPSNADALVGVGEAYLSIKDTGTAARVFQQVLEIAPTHPKARRELFQLALRTGNNVEALAIAREAQRVDPRAPLGHELEGDAHQASRDLVRAIGAYTSGLRLGNTSTLAIKLHTTLMAAGRQDQAQRVSVAWLKAYPRDPAFNFYLGDRAVQARDFALAERHYQVVADGQPRNALALNNLASMLIAQSKPGAVALAVKANLLLPDRVPLLNTLAEAHHAEKQFGAAIDTQRRAVLLAPQEPRLKLVLARYLVDAKEKAAAREQLESLAALGDKFPEQARVRAMLAAL